MKLKKGQVYCWKIREGYSRDIPAHGTFVEKIKVLPKELNVLLFSDSEGDLIPILERSILEIEAVS
jgi:hypothetical protein